jgi:hypothetical protein
MRQIMMLVEGQTEEAFVNKVLQPYLLEKQIFVNVTMVCTKKVKNSRVHRGGFSDFDQVNRDITRLLKSSHFDLITTFIDYYGLPSNFPGYGSVPDSNCYEKVNHLETEFARHISNEKFLPFIMLHEFESMIFCDAHSLTGFFSERKLEKLNRMALQYDSPELINNSPQTAPSKRILSELENYEKPLHGPIAVQNIGLEKIRNLCPHFNEWISYIEKI